MKFLTDGTRFIGPYSDDEPFGLARGVRTLREVFDAIEVHAIEATTVEEARAEWRKLRARSR